MIDKDTSIIDILKFDNPSNMIGSVAQLKTLLIGPPFNVECKTKGKFVLFKYDQIEGDFSYKIVNECRGIILDSETNRIVCYPFNKFWNYGEQYAANIDWESAEILEKVDGSIIKLWYYENEWHVSTNGTIDAKEAHVGDSDSRTFMDLFNDAIKNTPIDYSKLAKDCTHIFELVHPESRIVVPYPAPALYYLGSRLVFHGGKSNFKETTFKHYLNMPLPKSYKFNTIEECIETSKNLPFSEEGYVAVDKNMNRIKIKSPNYIAVNHLRMNGIVTKKRVLDVILRGQEQEFLNYFKDYMGIFFTVGSDLSIYIDKISDDFSHLSRLNLKTRKEFALEALKSTNAHVMFKFYGQDATKKETHMAMKKYIWDMGSDKLSELIYGDK